MPFAITHLSSNPDLWCPCLYWSHFLHDSTFLFATPCLGKSSIIYPAQQTQLWDVIGTFSVSVAGCWPFCRICISLYVLPAQLRENYGSVQRLGFKMNRKSSEKEDKKKMEIYFKVQDQNFEAYRTYLTPATQSVICRPAVLESHAAYYKWKTSYLNQDLLNQNLHLNKIFNECVCTLGFEICLSNSTLLFADKETGSQVSSLCQLTELCTSDRLGLEP